VKQSSSPARGRDPGLRRTLSLPLLTLYGVGTTVGAGVYALMGEVAGEAGLFAPVAFGLASLLAAFTALSFAELSARFPRSAGEAVYVREGLGSERLATTVGLGVAAAGAVSAATIANGFVGYFVELVAAPRPLVELGVVALLGAIAAWGIRESVTLAAVVTVVEVVGLFAVIAASGDALLTLPTRWPELRPPLDAAVWSGIGSAAFLAFYAFLGFEDMVNVAEEVVDVRRVMPLAIGLTLLFTVVLYLALAVACVLVVPPAELARSEAPLALVFERATGRSAAAINAVGVLAMLNGGLVQMILASRVLYGLASLGAVPAALGRVHARTQTPLVATGAVTAAVAVLTLAFALAPLARTTALITLSVFALVNLSLWRIHRRDPTPSVTHVPRWAPPLGLLVSVAFLAFELLRRLVP